MRIRLLPIWLLRVRLGRTELLADRRRAWLRRLLRRRLGRLRRRLGRRRLGCWDGA
ncbi:MAG TPA: hypothetical protein VG317_02330 [Pseudonocardiaceae bacterium]|nr:hypothetical protein [Pseudonocardiaceae bacterium]